MELLSRKKIEHEETAHLEKAMEQVEDNLKQSTVSIEISVFQFYVKNDYYMRCILFFFLFLSRINFPIVPSKTR